MKFILGEKLHMTQTFRDDGTLVPATVVKAGPCTVVKVKSAGKDRVAAVQFGYGAAKRLRKPQAGEWAGLSPMRFLREVQGDFPMTRGDTWNASVFAPGDTVDVIGTSKGKGFQGVVKRHGFAGSPASHGHKDQLRMPGSIGSKRQGPVQKGKRMAGHMGDARVTVKNLEIVKVDPEQGLLYLKGAVPGARGGLVFIKGEGEMQVQKTGQTATDRDTDTHGSQIATEAADAQAPAAIGENL